MNAEDNGFEDAKLNSTGQQAIRDMVRALPDESVSMTWRSSLNEQLLVLAAKQQKKRRILWFARPAAGLSLAMGLALVLMFMPSAHQTVKAPDRGIESAILSDHRSSALLNEVSSAGLNLTEVTTEANTSDPDDGQWSAADVESL